MVRAEIHTPRWFPIRLVERDYLNSLIEPNRESKLAELRRRVDAIIGLRCVEASPSALVIVPSQRPVLDGLVVMAEVEYVSDLVATVPLGCRGVHIRGRNVDTRSQSRAVYMIELRVPHFQAATDLASVPSFTGSYALSMFPMGFLASMAVSYGPCGVEGQTLGWVTHQGAVRRQHGALMRVSVPGGVTVGVGVHGLSPYVRITASNEVHMGGRAWLATELGLFQSKTTIPGPARFLMGDPCWPRGADAYAVATLSWRRRGVEASCAMTLGMVQWPAVGEAVALRLGTSARLTVRYGAFRAVVQWPFVLGAPLFLLALSLLGEL
jgi:hypothetical protein